jgi:hypothetical protein
MNKWVPEWRPSIVRRNGRNIQVKSDQCRMILPFRSGNVKLAGKELGMFYHVIS